VHRANVGWRRASPAWLLLLLLSVCALAVACSDDSATGPLSTTELTLRTAAGDTVHVQAEIADTADERARGLMSRDSLPEGRGMLFVFGGQTGASFWMKNTKVPLSIAFIDSHGRILDIQDMQPLSLDMRRSSQPYYFALEVNQGWFARRHAAVGDTVTGLP
jgi:uncharacterized membrane protein (UPF0127 family)